jgi:hypothetical protein
LLINASISEKRKSCDSAKALLGIGQTPLEARHFREVFGWNYRTLHPADSKHRTDPTVQLAGVLLSSPTPERDAIQFWQRGASTRTF